MTVCSTTGKLMRPKAKGLYWCRFCRGWHASSRPTDKRYKAKTVTKAPSRGAVERVWEL